MKKAFHHYETLSRTALKGVQGGGRREDSYCHLDTCKRNGCAALGGVPCRCIYSGSWDKEGLCVRIR
ncbi:hypothetical protein KTO58_07190 [Chitinophaga pendula]|uniref:hypothetical protein n=1 Tax=Chitinophaga TaxID=79328 RepID=UPI000BAFE81F|nr:MULTISPECIES: hypothetical protein [Chitinophaga]ASZ13414.1 hypothetical protein CK934_21850 [Chitinophaga sp. MD30]UCJ08961.1 hypothetical protein KTO58_07190 [Chitinophaga pendula]